MTDLPPRPSGEVPRAGGRLFAAVEVAASLMLGLMVLAILFQVVARYVFAHPPFWTEELARYAMIWAGTLGAALAFWYAADPGFVEPGAVFRGPLARVGALVATVPALVFAGMLLYQSLVGPRFDVTRGFVARNLTRESEALQVTMAFVAAAFPVMALLILIAGALRIAALLRAGRTRSEE
ncbi:MAG: TRAP transporter small permease subunit [Xanthobacteraceae bacterium]|nr:TRAP transporter small permease subunit [Xanthobacteraceae bacterium]